MGLLVNNPLLHIFPGNFFLCTYQLLQYRSIRFILLLREELQKQGGLLLFFLVLFSFLSQFYFCFIYKS